MRYPIGQRVTGTTTSVTDFGVFVEIEDGIEGLIHVSQLSTERIDRPQEAFQEGQKIEAEVTSIDTKDRKIALSVKALRKSEEREEIETYMEKEREGGRFSFDDILKSDLRLDRDEGSASAAAPEGEDTGHSDADDGTTE